MESALDILEKKLKEGLTVKIEHWVDRYYATLHGDVDYTAIQADAPTALAALKHLELAIIIKEENTK